MTVEKVISCKDSGFDDCTFVGRSESEEDLIAQVKKHAKKAHNMDLNDEMISQIKSLIHEEVH